jgi:hypothetical protein
VTETKSPNTGKRKTTPPTFSLIIETENLAVEGPEVLMTALASLAAQSVSPELASEVFLINSGGVPEAIEEQIRTRFPWIRWHDIDPDSDYYDAKDSVTRLATGDVLVFCDCDCRYVDCWLESMLSPFHERAGVVQVVTGETAIQVESAYTLLVALSFAFPPHSQRDDLYPTQGYAFNNVAFHRDLLMLFPIPLGMNMYRGNCTRHARDIRDAGLVIWKAARAKAFHPPLKPSHIVTRFFMWGHHELRVAKSRASNQARLRRVLSIFLACLHVLSRRFAMFFYRLPSQNRQGGLSLSRLLFAFPAFLVLYLAFAFGMLLTLIYPALNLTGLGKRLEAEH